MQSTPRKIFHIDTYDPESEVATFRVPMGSDECDNLMVGLPGSQLIEFVASPVSRPRVTILRASVTRTEREAAMQAARAKAAESALAVAHAQRDDYAARLDALHDVFETLSRAFTVALQGVEVPAKAEGTPSGQGRCLDCGWVGGGTHAPGCSEA